MSYGLIARCGSRRDRLEGGKPGGGPKGSSNSAVLRLERKVASGWGPLVTLALEPLAQRLAPPAR